ncbi:hypothetical protein [Flectobacillus sp. BAB-3569]|uniref:hypothetical protein n=1 Tax=Flectobacillus sp. BAB-3569 TaxID=1509483 RepID=UPI000BA37547|nr:hypothetical protein [Flectobacillus sp. BAB-3569]PAC27058.1 hypothetical protein BWI92_24375 [Flectobacillus sp. BAB-3569]
MELKIINLRDMNSRENQDIVEIINEVMSQKFNHSANKAVQHIIRTYKRQEIENNKLRAELQKLKKESEQSQKEQSDTIKELHSAIEGFNKFLIVANKVTPKK